MVDYGHSSRFGTRLGQLAYYFGHIGSSRLHEYICMFYHRVELEVRFVAPFSDALFEDLFGTIDFESVGHMLSHYQHRHVANHSFYITLHGAVVAIEEGCEKGVRYQACPG